MYTQRILMALFLGSLLLQTEVLGQTGETHRMTFSHQGSDRSFRLYVPADYDGGEPWPLVINFHGFVMDELLQMRVDSMDVAADDAHFLVAYARGLSVTFDGKTAQGWNMDGQRSNTDDVDYARRLIELTTADYSIDPNRIHAVGFSMGAMMAQRLACELPDQIASVAGVAGPMNRLLMDACKPTRPISVMLVHGTDDQNFTSMAPLETVDFWVEHNGCSTEPELKELEDTDPDDNSTVTVYTYSGCATDLSRETKVVYFSVDGGGHTWPGGAPLIPGNDQINRDFNASPTILDFFSEHVQTVATEDTAPDRAPTTAVIATYPNPTSGRVILALNLERASDIEVTITNVLGQRFGTVASRSLQPGRQTVPVDIGSAVTSAGVYFLGVEVGERHSGVPIVYRP